MRVTIIRDDNFVSVDGEGYKVDCSSLPADFHALQWTGATGEVEYRMTVCTHCGARSKKPNATIADTTEFKPQLDGWHAAKLAADAKKKAKADAARLEG
jgi:hypothetical protein